MADLNFHENEKMTDADVFSLEENPGVYDFVSIDHSMDNLSNVVMIDMSQDEFFDVIDIDTHMESDAFVVLEDQILTADFTDADFIAGIIDLDTLKE